MTIQKQQKGFDGSPSCTAKQTYSIKKWILSSFFMLFILVVLGNWIAVAAAVECTDCHHDYGIAVNSTQHNTIKA
ncbi:MAG: hypothetical protein K0A89_10795 [ANME-2 cluster archaeon]|nr:hypothetical protein [ANME-2 cluster archaeon]